MRLLLHLVSFALMLPGLAFAAYFLLLGHAISGGSLLAFLDRMLSDAAAFATWGIFAAGGFLALVLVSGLFVRVRWLAAFCVMILSIASTFVLIALGSEPFSSGRWLFLVPGLISFALSGWIVASERPRAAQVRSVA
jgi:hypothetical protein